MKQILLFTVWVALGMGCCGAADLLSLTNKAGVTIKAQLLGRGEDSAKVKVEGKTFEIRYDQLTEESVAAVKAAEIVVSTSDEVRLHVDIRKSGEIKKSGRVTVDRFDNVDDTTGSYRIDTVSGSVSLTNRHNQDPTGAGTLELVILKRRDSTVEAMHRQSYTLPLLDRFETRKFEINPSTSTHSEKGMANNLNQPKGRYIGYIAAMYVDGEIVALKAVPSSYERDRDAAVKLLKTGSGDKKAEDGGKKARPGGPKGPRK